MNPRIQPVILAGGSGTRLWPLSTEALPKQFQPLDGNSSTFESTLLRVSNPAEFLPPLVVTSKQYASDAKSLGQRLGIACSFLIEPCRRDSAAAMIAATQLVQIRHPGTAILTLAADHVIEGEDAFAESIRSGLQLAAKGHVVTFGIRPDRPATSYGYIRPDAPVPDVPDAFDVSAFVEKPDIATAERFVRDGYFWNSGNFLFRSDVMLDHCRAHCPDILAAVSNAIESGQDSGPEVILDEAAFSAARRISIDYAVMEKLSDMAVVACRYTWSDIGTWDALWQFLSHDDDGNAVVGPALATASSNCMIHSLDRLTVVHGLENVAVISTLHATLVLPRSRSEDVKKIADRVGSARPEAAQASKGVRSDVIFADAAHSVVRHSVEPGSSLSIDEPGASLLVAGGTGSLRQGTHRQSLAVGDQIVAERDQSAEIGAHGAIPLVLLQIRPRSNSGP